MLGGEKRVRRGYPKYVREWSPLAVAEIARLKRNVPNAYRGVAGNNYLIKPLAWQVNRNVHMNILLIKGLSKYDTLVPRRVQMVPISLRHMILFIHLTSRDNNLITNNPID